MSTKKPPDVLDMMADIVLRYRPKPKTKATKKRKKAAKKKERERELVPENSHL